MLLRTAIGEEIRRNRINQGRTLRDVAKSAVVSLGYLSEIERGVKEPSSEMLTAICAALDITVGNLVMAAGAQLQLSALSAEVIALRPTVTVNAA
ncbi:MAG: helix-turn-helix transcriptional regulator [Actinobacteria bacterium]|nr:helix-turn-helix transcriptional regulator [Actinomycetota bacterium]